MSLEHILLGMLKEPASGYQLRKDFSEGARHFWAAELNQIYPTLERMERRKWLRSKKEPSPKGPPRRVYHRTATGKKELLKWVKSAPVMGKERFAYIAQLVFLNEANDLDSTEKFINQLKESLTATFHFLGGIADELKEEFTKAPSNQTSGDFHDLLALNLGVQSLRGKLTACDEALEMIKLKKQLGGLND